PAGTVGADRGLGRDVRASRIPGTGRSGRFGERVVDEASALSRWRRTGCESKHKRERRAGCEQDHTSHTRTSSRVGVRERVVFPATPNWQTESVADTTATN